MERLPANFITKFENAMTDFGDGSTYPEVFINFVNTTRALSSNEFRSFINNPGLRLDQSSLNLAQKEHIQQNITQDNDKEVRNIAYILWVNVPMQTYFLGLSYSLRVTFLLNYFEVNYQEASALARLEQDNFDVVMKIGRPPGSPLKSVEFTILSI